MRKLLFAALVLTACGGSSEAPTAEAEAEIRRPRLCGARLGDTCRRGEFCDFDEAAICGWADAPGICRPIPRGCPKNLAPVCGCDQTTYPNECYANRAGVSVLHQGACIIPPVACGARLGNTCASDAYCDFTDSAGCGRTDIPGTCQPRPTFCTREYRPVCGCDGRTYSNACTAAFHGIDVSHQGSCRIRPRPARALSPGR